MTTGVVDLGGLRPGMEHLTLRVRVVSVSGERGVKTASGLEHRILDGILEDSSAQRGFAAWNEKIDLFRDVKPGDELELTECFVTSFRGVLTVNVGRGSEVRRLSP